MNSLMQEAQKWVQGDEKLFKLLKRIEASTKTDEEAALAMYDQVSTMYHLPKTYEEITDQVYDEYEALDKEPHYVFEELAIINYLQPEETIKNNVLLALYTIFMKEHMDVEQAAIKHYGSKEKVPDRFFVFLFGKDIDAIISFTIPDGLERWTDSGAVAMWQFGV